MLRRFCSYYRYYKGLFALDMAAALVSSLLSLLSPAIVRYILSTALPGRLFVQIVWLLIGIIVIYMIYFVFFKRKGGSVFYIQNFFDKFVKICGVCDVTTSLTGYVKFSADLFVSVH